jgi:3-oxoacyl-[acyl-carrier-protein] synthase-3
MSQTTSPIRSAILGLGTFVPPWIVKNDDLKQWMDTSNEWIIERTGIEQRHWVERGSTTGASDLAVEASRKAIEQAGLKPEQISMIVFATLSPDCEFPGTGVFLQRKLGLKPIPVLDIRQQCTGFLYGLSIADQFIKSGAAEYVLVVGAEVHSSGLDLTTRGRDVSVLFGDGAGAAVVGKSPDPERGILSTHLYADGTFAEDLWLNAISSARSPRITKELIDEGKIYPMMNGKNVFKHAVTRMPEVVKEAMKANGKTVADIGCLIPHQANLRINEFVQKSLNLADDKVHNNIQKYGNTTAATIPICLEEAIQVGKVKQGDLVCLVAFGSGFTWGSILIRW